MKRKKNPAPMYYMVPPPNVDFGHAVNPRNMSERGKEDLMAMMGFTGGDLIDITRSEHNERSVNKTWDNGADAEALYDNLQRKLTQPVQGNRRQPVQEAYYGAQPAMPMPAPAPVQQDYQPTRKRKRMKEELNIGKYLGEEQPAAPRRDTGNFAEALEPLEDKMEIMCQILGRLYQVENTVAALVRSLPQGIASIMSQAMENYMAQEEEDIPEPETPALPVEEYDGDIPMAGVPIPDEADIPPALDPYAGEELEDDGLEPVDTGIVVEEPVVEAPAPAKAKRPVRKKTGK